MADFKLKELEKSFELFYKTQLNKILKTDGIKNVSELGAEDIEAITTVFFTIHLETLKKLFPQVKDISLDAIK